MDELILASASPRRREILSLLGITFTVVPAKSEDDIDPKLPLSDGVLKVARSKAEEVASLYPGRIVLGADTIVAVGGQILGKPADKQQACDMLRQLGGRTHEVLTAVWICRNDLAGGGSGFTDRVQVEFFPLDDAEIEDYVATGEPMDKAGGYGIQGKGIRFVRAIKGDFYTVMGLPGARLWRFLKKPEDDKSCNI